MKRSFLTVWTIGIFLLLGTYSWTQPTPKWAEFPQSQALPNIDKTPGQLALHVKADMTKPTHTEADFKALPYTKAELLVPGFLSHDIPLSNDLKIEVFKQYGIPAYKWSHYIINHLIPRSLGGSNNLANLWPQRIVFSCTLNEIVLDKGKEPPFREVKHTYSFGVKDKLWVENHLLQQVKNGTMSLDMAQAILQTDWTAIIRSNWLQSQNH